MYRVRARTELWNDADTAITSVRHERLYFGVRVLPTWRGSSARQPRNASGLERPDSSIMVVPVQHIQLRIRHRIKMLP